MRIHLLGPLLVTRDGQPVPAHEVASRKGRLLLRVLLAQRGANVPADLLAEVLWPERRPADVDANLGVLISRLRGVFGTAAIAATANGWRLAPAVDVDLDVALRLCAEAEDRLVAGEPALALAAADAATALLDRGEVLADEPDADWLTPARQDAERAATQARRAGWRAALRMGDPAAALRHAGAAVAADPLDESARRAVLRAHLAAGRTAQALAGYEELRELLADTLGVDPAEETQRLYLAALRPKSPDAGENVEPPGRSAAHGTSAEPLVGRAVEVAVLHRAWELAAARTAGLYLLLGEAGTGKTTLARHLADRAEAAGGLVLRARSYDAERSLFLQPWIEVVREAARVTLPDVLADAARGHAGSLADLVPEIRLAVRAGPPADRRDDPEVARRRAFDAVTGLLRGLAGRQPVLVVLDDLHLAGAATLELLHFAARQLTGARVLLLATVRVEETREIRDTLAGLATVVEVGALSPSAVEELAGLHGRPDLAAEVIRRGAGHPLFTVELLRAAKESGWPVARLPASLTEVVLARVRRAGADVERLLRAAAVVGSAFEVEPVAGLLSTDPARAADLAEQALATRLVVEAGSGYEFANDLLREVLYDTTPRPTRIVRHRHLASTLAGPPEAVAQHAAAAGDWPAAARAWLAAGAAAAARWANRDAEHLLDAAVAAADRAAADWAVSDRAAGDPAGAGDGALGARARLDRGRVRVSIGDYRAATDDLAAARATAELLGDTALAAQALEQLGWAAYYSRDLMAGSDLAAQARGLAEDAAAAAPDRPGPLLLVSRLRHADGDLDGAEDALARALGPAPAPELLAQGEPHRALLLGHRDRYADARRAADRAAAACQQVGAFKGLLTAAVTGIVVTGNQGDFAAALDWLARMTELLRHTEDAQYHARAATLGAWLWHELGQLDRARDLATQAVDLTVGSGSHPHLHALLGTADVALTSADESTAGDLLARAATVLEQPIAYGWRARLRYLDLLVRLDPSAGAQLLDAARVAGSPKYTALALAHLGRPGDALAAAAPTGSAFLTAQVAPEPAARAALQEVAAWLPADLRPGFLTSGRLARTRTDLGD